VSRAARGRYTSRQRSAAIPSDTPLVDSGWELEGSAAPTDDQVVAREALTRTRVQSVRPCDVLQDPPMSGDPDQRFDLVIAGFSLEVAVSDTEGFHKALLNVLSLVSPGGVAVVMGLSRCSAYLLNGYWHACYAVDPREVAEAFEEARFFDVDIQIREVPQLAPAGYSEVFFGSATRPSA
jgi:NNMT/PNMT/TEMT family